ncbi:acetyltransferase [Pandoraea cepalis]|uniref:Acetyltransferase n=2 Tax=Pandoraea cepalis TaxID=2508294 RepID=A0A5E4XF63_9BURK|nr:acetyltransferase [Pandoraea cepalis]
MVLGAGGHGAVVADIASAVWPDVTISFLDDRYGTLSRVFDWPVVGNFESALKLIDADSGFIVAIGNNRARHDWLNRLLEAGAVSPVLMHPTAVVSSRARLGAGTVVFATAVIQIGATVGRGCIVNTAAVVEHDCQLGDAVHICPQVGLAGNVTIGSRSTLGVGTSVRQGIEIGSDVVIGAGSAVVRDIASSALAYGVPAVTKLEI